MRPNRTNIDRRCAFSLLELLAAATITATLMVSSMVVIRSSYAAWQAHEGDFTAASSADAVLRHIMRAVRQSEGVTAMTDSSDTTGRLDLVVDGTALYWEHTGTSDGYVVYNSPTSIVASAIDSLIFTGYRADGVTVTTDPSEIQLIHCTVSVTMPRGGGQTRTVSCMAWLRSW